MLTRRALTDLAGSVCRRRRVPPPSVCCRAQGAFDAGSQPISGRGDPGGVAGEWPPVRWRGRSARKPRRSSTAPPGCRCRSVSCTRRFCASISSVPRSMTWRITVHHTTPSPAAVRDTAASAAPTCSNAHPGPARSAPPAARSPRAARSRSAARTAAAGRPRPASTSTAPPPARRSAGRAPRSGGGPSPALPPRNPGNRPGPRWSAPAAPARRRHRQRQDLEPGESEQGSPHRRRIVFHPGAFHARVRLAVITNREGPRDLPQLTCQPRRVGTQAHVPGSMRRAGKGSACQYGSVPTTDQNVRDSSSFGSAPARTLKALLRRRPDFLVRSAWPAGDWPAPAPAAASLRPAPRSML